MADRSRVVTSFDRRDFLRTLVGSSAAALLTPVHAAAGALAPARPRSSAEIVRRIVPPRFGPGAMHFGALVGRAGPADDVRDRLQGAIAELSARGGGRVTVPAGQWRIGGPLRLYSGVELHLERDATLRFDADPARYLPGVLTRWEGTECYNYSPFVYAYQASDVGITGAGTLDGNARESFATWKPQQEAAQLRLREMGARGTPVHERRFGAGDWLRPGFVQFFGCRHVLIEGITLVDSPFWVVHPVYCAHVIMRGTTVRSTNLNNDGIDPDSSRLVLVEDAHFETGDDAVAIKSGRVADAWRVGVPSREIVIRRCRMPKVWNGVCIGSEMSGGVHDVHIESCTLGTTRSALLFKGNLDRGGAVTGVRVRDITVQESITLLDFTTAYHGYRGGQFPPRFHDFEVDRLRCERTTLALRLVGDAGAPLEGIRLRDITVATAQRSHEVAHVRALDARRVQINARPVVLPASA
ncbi:MAG: glycoside hydrolase family 28 protein [Gemmatimonadaceae bacterium]|nr:glycoside hydrolase family 28 protein [Gemmatimonadaceae bacterium]